MGATRYRQPKAPGWLPAISTYCHNQHDNVTDMQRPIKMPRIKGRGTRRSGERIEYALCDNGTTVKSSLWITQGQPKIEKEPMASEGAARSLRFSRTNRFVLIARGARPGSVCHHDPLAFRRWYSERLVFWDWLCCAPFSACGNISN
jgi:hypothetical protein